MVKKQRGEKTSSSSSYSTSAANDNIIKDHTRQNYQSFPKKNMLKMVMKTMRMMKARTIKSVELPETEEKRLNNLIQPAE